MAWLTPDLDPLGWGTVRLVIECPNNPYFWGQLRALLVDLNSAENYEKHGTATPQETADAWEKAAYQVFEPEIECPPDE